MAEHPRQQLQTHGEALKSILPEKRSTSSQILVVLTLLPVGGFLLLLGGVTLSGTLIGLAVTTPLFVIFSPVLVPAALVISLAVMGFLASGAFVVTALSSLSWMANNFRRIKGGPSPNPQEEHVKVKRRTMEILDRVGRKTREAEQAVVTKAQEKTETQEKTKSPG